MEDSIRYRKAVMIMIKWHYDRLAKHAKGTIPLAHDEVDRNAAWLDALSKNAAEGFIPGSSDGDTKALPSIWIDGPTFQGLIERFQGDATKLRTVVRKGDATALKLQLDDMAKTCKTCHDDFKKS